MVNPFDIFARASRNQPLTPEERGFLKIVQGLGWGAVIAALGVLTPLLTSGQFEFNQTTIIAVSTAFVVALLNGVAKLVSAKGDAGSIAVGGAISAAAQDIQRSLERNDVIRSQPQQPSPQPEPATVPHG